MRRLALLAAALSFVGLTTGCGGHSQVAFTLGTADRNVSYCNAQTLDLFVPQVAGRRPLPLAIYVHGGGMTSGSSADLNPVLLDTLARAGYAVASLNYRLAPKFKFPAELEDVKCAIRFLRAHASVYGLNGRAIFAFGTSVGGELVALAALTGPHSTFDVGPFPRQPSGVLAVADFFGPANVTQAASGFSASGRSDAFGDNPGAPILASPTHYIRAHAPPILIVQGVNDTKVLKSQAIELYTDLRAAGNGAQLVLVANMGHMFAHVGSKPLSPSVAQIAHDMVNFFDKYVPN